MEQQRPLNPTVPYIFLGLLLVGSVIMAIVGDMFDHIVMPVFALFTIGCLIWVNRKAAASRLQAEQPAKPLVWETPYGDGMDL